MARYKPGKRSKWEKLPFTIGAEGPQFLPSNFGEGRGTSPKTVKTGKVGSASGSRVYKKKKSVPKKVT